MHILADETRRANGLRDRPRARQDGAYFWLNRRWTPDLWAGAKHSFVFSRRAARSPKRTAEGGVRTNPQELCRQIETVPFPDGRAGDDTGLPGAPLQSNWLYFGRGFCRVDDKLGELGQIPCAEDACVQGRGDPRGLSDAPKRGMLAAIGLSQGRPKSDTRSRRFPSAFARTTTGRGGA